MTSQTILKPSTYQLSKTESCTPEEASFFFAQKVLLNPPDLLSSDPFLNPNQEYLKKVDDYLRNKDIVCGIRYEDESKTSYRLSTFNSRYAAERNNYIVTHQGRCGACSSLQDLSLFLIRDLTVPTRYCCFLDLINANWSHKCMKKIGYSDACTQLWIYGARQTKRSCFGVCLKAWILGTPNNKPNGDLNDCLQCDEDVSGPILKYEEGRNRRNSGIISEISRPGDQVYDVDQCYF
jgi:hypothetical protein